MRFALSDEQIEFRDAVRGLLADTCGPDDIRAAWADPVLAGGGPGGGNGTVPAAWSALGEMGVLGICVPEKLIEAVYLDQRFTTGNVVVWHHADQALEVLPTNRA